MIKRLRSVLARLLTIAWIGILAVLVISGVTKTHNEAAKAATLPRKSNMGKRAERSQAAHKRIIHIVTHRIVSLRHLVTGMPSHVRSAVGGWVTMTIKTSAYVVNPAERGGKCPVFTNKTADGYDAWRGTLAADHHVFPKGTIMEIKGYGKGVVTDTGDPNYIYGNHVDLAMLSCTKALDWGRKTIVARVLFPGSRSGLVAAR